jgi:hypothetical protein
MNKNVNCPWKVGKFPNLLRWAIFFKVCVLFVFKQIDLEISLHYHSAPCPHLEQVRHPAIESNTNRALIAAVVRLRLTGIQHPHLLLSPAPTQQLQLLHL